METSETPLDPPLQVTSQINQFLYIGYFSHIGEECVKNNQCTKIGWYCVIGLHTLLLYMIASPVMLHIYCMHACFSDFGTVVPTSKSCLTSFFIPSNALLQSEPGLLSHVRNNEETAFNYIYTKAFLVQSLPGRVW